MWTVWGRFCYKNCFWEPCEKSLSPIWHFGPGFLPLQRVQSQIWQCQGGEKAPERSSRKSFGKLWLLWTLFRLLHKQGPFETAHVQTCCTCIQVSKLSKEKIPYKWGAGGTYVLHQMLFEGICRVSSVWKSLFAHGEPEEAHQRQPWQRAQVAVQDLPHILLQHEIDETAFTKGA